MEEARDKVTEAYQNAETILKPSWEHLFKDVYKELTPELERQRNELLEHLTRFGHEKFYSLQGYAKST